DRRDGSVGLGQTRRDDGAIRGSTQGIPQPIRRALVAAYPPVCQVGAPVVGGQPTCLRPCSQCIDLAMATTCRSVSEPATPYTWPWLCHTTPLAMPVVSPTTRPGAPLMSAAWAEASEVGIGIGRVDDRSPSALIWLASEGGTPGFDSGASS